MQIKTRQDLINAYVSFFKKHKHKHIPSAPIIPENDPTVLFNTAGMQPIIPYLLGQKHPLGKRLVNVQKCIRTVDLDNIGDTYHHTFFEMLGNWSLGDYWKSEAIKLTFEFHTQSLKIPIEKYAVSCFGGDPDYLQIPKDEESARIWAELGIPKDRITFIPGGVKDAKDNWWGPAGETGPCGSSTEQFYWKPNTLAPAKFDPSDDNWVEIGNDVLMEYEKSKSGEFTKAKQQNIDFGGGVERTLAILNGFDDNYLTESWKPIIKKIESLSKKKYGSSAENTKAIRIIADHIRAAVFILGDERSIAPSNIGQGYILRRLIRRAIRYGKMIGLEKDFTSQVAQSVLPIYPDYQELHKNKSFIKEQLETEESRFSETLEKGLAQFKKLSSDKIITGKEAFLLFQSFGFPIEMTQELALEKGVKVDLVSYNKEFKKHQDLSRTSSAGQFKSGLADSSSNTRRLHTATHLLNEALRSVISPDIKQKGSNINPERLRFDFNFPRKLTPEEIEKIESFINDKIKAALTVERSELPLQEALSSGAQAEFGAKYPELVSLYTIHDPSDKRGWSSKEICTGPHVENTKEIGHFKIVKESSSAAGVRRIKAIVEN